MYVFLALMSVCGLLSPPHLNIPLDSIADFRDNANLLKVLKNECCKEGARP
jgi:hypothetical protein